MAIAKNDRNLYTADEIMAKWRDRSDYGWGMNTYEPNEADAERVAAIGSRAAQETAANVIAQAPFIAITRHMTDKAKQAETAKTLGSRMSVLVLADDYNAEGIGAALGLDGYNGKSYGDGDIVWRVLVPEFDNDGSPLLGTIIAEGASDYTWLFDVRDALAKLGLKLDMTTRPEVSNEAEDDLQRGGVDIMPYTAECFELTVGF